MVELIQKLFELGGFAAFPADRIAPGSVALRLLLTAPCNVPGATIRALQDGILARSGDCGRVFAELSQVVDADFNVIARLFDFLLAAVAREPWRSAMGSHAAHPLLAALINGQPHEIDAPAEVRDFFTGRNE
jgi:hypothetical protein